MTLRFRSAALACGILAVATIGLHADVKTQSRSQVKFEGMLGRMMGLFGGKAAKEGIVSTTAVKGNRKMTSNESTGQIIDLSEEKIYDLDLKKKTYQVTTFDELRQKMKEAQEKAAEDAKKAQQQEKGQEERAQSDQNQKQYEVDFNMKETGQKKQIAGYDTHEVVMTVVVREKGKTLEQSGGVVLTADSWLAPGVKGMKELADFDLRYFQKLYGPIDPSVSADQMAAALAMYPWLKQAQERMNKEKVNMDGTPLATATTFEAVKSQEQFEQEQKQKSEEKGGGGLGGMLARKMMKKDAGEAKPRVTVFTVTNEVLSLGEDAGDLAIPPGFKQK